ncbi:histidine--tRNA ligase, partial [Campylobacter jejuni]|nr:histidine--tRNA ligase [Campylobacter jejuni]
VLDCKNEHCQSLLNDAPLLNQNLCSSCQKDFEILQSVLKENGVDFEVDSKLVRGLDYYSKTAFEFISDEIGAKAAIAGGGRYDRLIEYLDGKSGFGVGFAMGIERIIAILEQKEEKVQREGIY